MKNSFKVLITILLSTFLISSSLPAKKQKIHGTWRMVSGITNGVPNPQLTVKRMQEFKADNTFESKIFLPDGIRNANSGLYSLIDDSTMVTVHKNPDGSISPLANKYNFTIEKDTLHLYGFYLTGSSEQRGLLQMVHLDELWVKEKLQ